MCVADSWHKLPKLVKGCRFIRKCIQVGSSLLKLDHTVAATHRNTRTGKVCVYLPHCLISAREAGAMTYLSDCVFAFTFPVNCEPFDGFIPSKFTDYIQCNLPPAFYYIFFSRDSPTCVTTYVF